MKPSTTDYFRVESQGLTLSSVTSASGANCQMGTTLYSSSPLFGLSGLCDQISAFSTSELSGSGSPPEYSLGLASPSSNGASPIISNSLLGSSLHNSVSRSYSDSTRQDRTKNLFAGSEPYPSPIHCGWHSEQDPSPFINTSIDRWSLPHPPLSSSKSHTEVFRSFSDRIRTDEDLISRPIVLGNEKSFLWNLKIASGNASDYDTLLKNYNNKVLFALKLGYTETLLQKALQKLGLNAEENQILEELIRLQKSKPSDGTCSPLGRQTSDEKGSCSSIKSDSGSDISETDLLPIVIDGSNVAISHGNKERFSCKGIRICVDWFLARGHRDITVFVPLWRKEASKPDTPISDQHILTDLEKEGLLSFTPSRQVLGRRYVCHDDRYILNLASCTEAIVVSNDNYRELVNDKPEFKKVIEEKILMYTFVNDRFMPPDDPFGRGGPTLDAFLRRPKYGLSTNIQPCPYEKKCTYGNKCKFYHPDRGNQPQKSIIDYLKESSHKKISEVRARSPSNESAGDSLMRTQSMQPVSSTDQRFANKKALERTRSLWTQHQPNRFGEAMPTISWPNQQQQAQNLRLLNHSKPMVDTSVLPPPPRVNWTPLDSSLRFDPGEVVPSINTHQKLERQYTLRPNDPRIQVTSYTGESNDTFSYPPPIIGNFNHLHFPVKRIASAPESTSQRMSRSPVPSLAQIEGELHEGPTPTLHPLHQQIQHQHQLHQIPFGKAVGDRRTIMPLPPHLHSDMKLCKSKSE